MNQNQLSKVRDWHDWMDNEWLIVGIFDYENL